MLIVCATHFYFYFFRDLRSNNSVEDIHLDQFLKVSNYEDTVKQLDIYYGIGNAV